MGGRRQNIDQVVSTDKERTVATAEELADQWAEEVGLSEIVRKITGKPEQIDAIVRQAFCEGAFRGLEARKMLDKKIKGIES